MGWINANDFYNRSLQNDLVSLRALRVATLDLAMAKQRATGTHYDVSETLNDIDNAIASTEAVIKSVAHHG